MGAYSAIPASIRSSRYDNAYDAAQCWEDHPKAQALLGKVNRLEILADEFAGDEHLSGLGSDIGDYATSLIEVELDNLRRELIAEAMAESQVEDDEGHGYDELCDKAPTVEEALDRVRRARGAGVVTPLGDGSCRVGS